MVQRVTYRRRLGYNTRSNKVKVIKTPGANLRVLHLKKRGTVPKCGDCKKALQGLPACRPFQLASLSKRQKTVNRAYGGSRCSSCVKNRILRAFLIEEHKIVKKVMKTKKSEQKVIAPTKEIAEKAEKKAIKKPTSGKK